MFLSINASTHFGNNFGSGAGFKKPNLFAAFFVPPARSDPGRTELTLVVAADGVLLDPRLID
jgi:hypothetical protein